MTRTEARQMSGPVPSPSMKGTIGWSGTVSLPFWMVIFCPCGGTFSLTGVDIDELRGVWSLQGLGHFWGCECYHRAAGSGRAGSKANVADTPPPAFSRRMAQP